MFGAIPQVSGEPEEDKKSMSILKSQRRANISCYHSCYDNRY
jgi:hypothetical protein